MPPLHQFPLPLPSNGPPPGYSLGDRALSTLSTTTAFNNGIEQRDIFLGKNRCVICGTTGSVLQHCHIIWDSEPRLWSDLKNRGWIPLRAKDLPRHEPRNGLLMCSNHHINFDRYEFFIRYFPGIRKFVLVNYSDQPDLRQFHGKAIALDIDHRHSPFPSLFIIHEMRVRGYHPFAPIAPHMPNNIAWQDWISSEGMLRPDNEPGLFISDSQATATSPAESQLQFQPSTSTASADGASSGGLTLALNENVIAEILAATRASLSWRTCQMEGTSWDGTAQENIQRYVTDIGLQDP